METSFKVRLKYGLCQQVQYMRVYVYFSVSTVQQNTTVLHYMAFICLHLQDEPDLNWFKLASCQFVSYK